MAITLDRLTEILAQGRREYRDKLMDRAREARKKATLARELALLPTEEKASVLDRLASGVTQAGVAFMTTGNPLLAAVSGTAGALKEEKYDPLKSGVSGAAQGAALKSVVGAEADPLKAIGEFGKTEKLGKSALALKSIVDPDSGLDVLSRLGQGQASKAEIIRKEKREDTKLEEKRKYEERKEDREAKRKTKADAMNEYNRQLAEIRGSKRSTIRNKENDFIANKKAFLDNYVNYSLDILSESKKTEIKEDYKNWLVKNKKIKSKKSLDEYQKERGL